MKRKNKKRKRRPINVSRSASLKGHRVKRQMQMARKEALEAVLRNYARGGGYGRTLDDMLPPERTINRIPKVEWKL